MRKKIPKLSVGNSMSGRSADGAVEGGFEHCGDMIATGPREMDMVAAHQAAGDPARCAASPAHRRGPVPISEAELARRCSLALAHALEERRSVPAVAADEAPGGGARSGVGRAEQQDRHVTVRQASD